MDEELIHLCEEIFRDTIAQLTLHMRFMDIALNRYIFVPDTYDFRCDGRVFHYSPITVIRMYRNDPHKLTHGYLHILLHSLFQHMWFADNRAMSLWDLACDIAVESVIIDLDLSITAQKNDAWKKKQIEAIRQDVPRFTAQRIYHYLEGQPKDAIRLLAEEFRFDAHDGWYHVRNVTGSRDALFGSETKDDAEGAGTNTFDQASHDSDRPISQPVSGEEEIRLMRRTSDDWKEISEKIEDDLELFKELHGQAPEALTQSLKQLHREKMDYSRFLQKFMQSGEKLQINDDEFDPIFYTYGLLLYEDMPLIEPQETRETRSIKELLIAIDTSGSVQGDTVQNFLQKTCTILSQQKNFFQRFRIHIVQCDMVIRDVCVIETPAQFNRYIQNVQLKGFGGTDFRPVFQYAREHSRTGEFRRLGGILYFTDGDGVYPKEKPSCPTAFLLPADAEKHTVPPWAIRYILEGDEYDAY
ncbi:MAG: hypothetical protein IKS37_00460 [Solobacterium sp.]|nr:hypothetical protein [Solobacterium sp.]